MSRQTDEGSDAVAGARDLFERASAGLDHGMAFRLRRARQQAQAPVRSQSPSGWLPAASLSAVVVAFAVGWWLPQRQMEPVTPAVSETEEIERLLTGEEDPDLYAWLADAPVATSGADAP
jgi:hypothetical protein